MRGWPSISTGRLCLSVCDDDSCFDRAITGLPAKIEEIGDDASVVGITGAVVIDNIQGSSVAAYRNVDSDDALTRVSAWLAAKIPPVLLFSPVRRDVLNWVTEVIRSKPFKLSFDDQICSMLYLLRGKFAPLSSALCYDQPNWEESRDGAAART